MAKLSVIKFGTGGRFFWILRWVSISDADSNSNSNSLNSKYFAGLELELELKVWKNVELELELESWLIKFFLKRVFSSVKVFGKNQNTSSMYKSLKTCSFIVVLAQNHWFFEVLKNPNRKKYFCWLDGLNHSSLLFDRMSLFPRSIFSNVNRPWSSSWIQEWWIGNRY